MKIRHLALPVLCGALALLTVNGTADIVYPQEREERDFGTTAAEKLDRGFQNLVIFPLAFTQAIYDNSGRTGYDNRGFLKGASDGLRNMSIRFAQGTFDTLTFPWNTASFELPWDPEPNVVHPEWVPVMNWAIPSTFDEYVDKSFNGWYVDPYEVWQSPD
jgi:hypothetical protein